MSATPRIGARVPSRTILAVAPKPRFPLMDQADLPVQSSLKKYPPRRTPKVELSLISEFQKLT
jgi:hypothetical protein